MDGQSERAIQTLEGMLRACVIEYGGRWGVHLPLAKLSYNNSYHSSILYALFEALHGRKLLIKERFKVVRDRQRSYAGNRRKPLEFEVLRGFLGDRQDSCSFDASFAHSCDAAICTLVGGSNIISGGLPAGINGLFSGWYCGLTSRNITLGVSMAWAKGVTTGTLVRYETSCGRLLDYNGLDIEMRKKECVLMEEKYLAASQRIKSICNYDDDEDDSIPLRDIIARYSPEPEDSLIMGDEHLDTIPEKESDELIKSSVENLVLIPKELNLEIADTILESLSPSPILVEDSDSHMEEIDLFLATNDSMPPGIVDDDYDSEGDIHFS
ncbi:putative reverse transcriptase domain-containing protein [Tanacetum coccineum]